MNNLLTNIQHKIKQDFDSQALLAEACLKILNFLLSVPYSDIKHISLANLYKISNCKLDTEQIILLASYLSGEVDLLVEHFEYIDEEDNSFDLEKSEVQEARINGFFIHPVTNAKIENINKKIFIYFLPTERVQELKGSPNG